MVNKTEDLFPQFGPQKVIKEIVIPDIFLNLNLTPFALQKINRQVKGLQFREMRI